MTTSIYNYISNVNMMREYDKLDITNKVFETNEIKGGLVLYVESNAWEKAIRIMNEGEAWDGTEIKCGDISGKCHTNDGATKYAHYRVNFQGNKTVRLELWKPKEAGVWVQLSTITIPPQERNTVDGKSFVIAWGNDRSSKYKPNDKIPAPYYYM
eukprot:gene9141-11207_t